MSTLATRWCSLGLLGTLLISNAGLAMAEGVSLCAEVKDKEERTLCL